MSQTPHLNISLNASNQYNNHMAIPDALDAFMENVIQIWWIGGFQFYFVSCVVLYDVQINSHIGAIFE